MRRHATVEQFDNLSAGEKAAIALMLPFVEQQADQLVTAPTTNPDVVPITMLMDAPAERPYSAGYVEVRILTSRTASMGGM